MPKIKGLELIADGYKVRQRLDFEEMSGVDLSESPDVLRQITQAVIDAIKERTQSGESAYGGSLGSYSKSYKDSLDFKAFGKSNPVDLTLTGDMLGSMDIVEENGSTLVIGFDGELQNAKAYGHQTGMKGNPILEGKVKPRPFFGMSYEEIKKEILPQFETEIRAAKALQPEPISPERQDLIRAQNEFRQFILDNLTEEEEA